MGGEVVYTPDPRYVGPDAFAWAPGDPCLGGEIVEVALTIYDAASGGAPQVAVETVALEARDVALVVNLEDPRSVAVADAYQAARRLTDAQRVHLSFPPEANLTPAEFEAVYESALAQAPAETQAWVLAFSRPFRVGGMSVTSAFALGYDPIYANTSDAPCADTAPVTTYLTTTPRPHDDHGVRPAMMLLGETEAEALALIDRGLASDRTQPKGTAYLVRTSDEARSVRWPQMLSAILDWEGGEGLQVDYLDNHAGALGTDLVTGAQDVLFYCTGLIHVDDLDTLTFLPGAFADHLTSLGGVLEGGSQMPVSAWLEAGATASYGTVAEPCNALAKFPNVRFVLQSVYRGRTLLEAVWTSVHWPGEGLLVGDPLARPFGKLGLTYGDETLTISTTWMAPGELWDLEAADAPSGPWETVQEALSAPALGPTEITAHDATRPYYRLTRRE
jgi:uncharacterized protein (TIGR03790 family)